MAKALLEAKDVQKYFPVTKGLMFTRVTDWIKAVDGIGFTVNQGETLGLAGESGCGKTTTARLILRIEKPTGGSILLEGQDIYRLSGAELRWYRSSVQAVFQDPYGSLNPRMRIADIIAEPLLANNTLPGVVVKERVAQVLERVGLSIAAASLYPHEFSGGQRQRIALGRALILNPRLIILDEPASALDVSIQAQLLNQLKDVQDRLGLTYVLIAHDLAVLEYMCSRICVMYLGKIVENAACEELYSHPLHPYTTALHSAALPSHPDVQSNEITLFGEVPSPLNPPAGCRFHPRCSRALRVCAEVEPLLLEVASGHLVACHLYSTPP